MTAPPQQTTLADNLLASKYLVVVLGMRQKQMMFPFSIPLISYKVQEFLKQLEFSPFEGLTVFLASHPK
jgi:hypothetical protein